MPKVNIKPSNYWRIKDFAEGRQRSDMQGSRVEALYTLIQKKGEPMETADVRLNGVKALQISENEYIAIKRAGPLHSFFPCSLQSISLTTL